MNWHKLFMEQQPQQQQQDYTLYFPMDGQDWRKQVARVQMIQKL